MELAIVLMVVGGLVLVMTVVAGTIARRRYLSGGMGDPIGTPEPAPVRLRINAPGAVESLEAVSDDGRRRVALAVAEWALDSAPVDEARVHEARMSLRQARLLSGLERALLLELVEQLDREAAQAKSRGDEEAAAAEFSRARAIHALASAHEPDAFTASVDAAYEALVATGDLAGLERLVETTLRPALR